MKRHPTGYWTYERCKEEISKCKKLSEIKNKMVYELHTN